MTADMGGPTRSTDEQRADHVMHCAWLYAAAEVLISGDAKLDRDARARIGRQLVDYAALLEHADREGWWDR